MTRVVSILSVALIIALVILMVSCVSQRVTVGDEETCVETRALVFTNIECELKDKVKE